MTGPEVFGYSGYIFEIRPCFGGVSATIWKGKQSEQCMELGLWPEFEDALQECVKWIDEQKETR